MTNICLLNQYIKYNIYFFIKNIYNMYLQIVVVSLSFRFSTYKTTYVKVIAIVMPIIDMSAKMTFIFHIFLVIFGLLLIKIIAAG